MEKKQFVSVRWDGDCGKINGNQAKKNVVNVKKKSKWMTSKQYLMAHFIRAITNFRHACIITEKQISLIFQLAFPLDRECKLNVHKTFRSRPERSRLVYRGVVSE